MKKNIILLSLFFLLFNVNNIFSQNIIIKGKIQKPIVNNQSLESESLVRLLTFNDMLTLEQSTVFETKSDKEGNFIIEADIEEITLAQIAIDLERVDILLKPNSTYEVEINIPEREENVSYFERQSPTIKITKSNDDDLYYQYHMTEMIIDEFIFNNFNRLYRGRKIALLDSLDVEIKRNLGDLKSDFVKDNIRYRKASIQMIINNDNGKKVINQYFNKQNILYSRHAYMNLFQEIFANYLSLTHFNPSELRDVLYSSHDTFLKYIKGNDAFLAENQEKLEYQVSLTFLLNSIQITEITI